MSKTDQRARMRPSETLAEYAKRLKEIGRKPLVLDVGDNDDAATRARIRQQSIEISQSSEEREIDDFIEAATADVMKDEPPYGETK